VSPADLVEKMAESMAEVFPEDREVLARSKEERYALENPLSKKTPDAKDAPDAKTKESSAGNNEAIVRAQIIQDFGNFIKSAALSTRLRLGVEKSPEEVEAILKDTLKGLIQ